LVGVEQQFTPPRHFHLVRPKVRPHDAGLGVPRPQQQMPYFVGDSSAQQITRVGFEIIRRLFDGWITDGGVAGIARRQHRESGGIGREVTRRRGQDLDVIIASAAPRNRNAGLRQDECGDGFGVMNGLRGNARRTDLKSKQENCDWGCHEADSGLIGCVPRYRGCH